MEHTLEEIKEAVKKYSHDISEEDINQLSQFIFDNQDTKFESSSVGGMLFDLSIGEVVSTDGYEHLQHEGGGEGGAQDVEGVWSINGTFYKFCYSYYSYHGYDYDFGSLFTVTPRQKTITVYE